MIYHSNCRSPCLFCYAYMPYNLYRAGGYKNKPLQSRDRHICHFIWQNKRDSTHVIKGDERGVILCFVPFLINHVCLMLLHMYVISTSHYCLICKCAQYDLSCRQALKHHSFIYSFIPMGRTGLLTPRHPKSSHGNLLGLVTANTF